MVFWTFAVCGGAILWLILNINIDSNYTSYPNLLLTSSGNYTFPKSLLNPTNFLHPPEGLLEQTTPTDLLYQFSQFTHLQASTWRSTYYQDPKDLDLSGYPVASQTKCGQHLDWIIQNVNLHPNFTRIKGELGHELTSLMNSFGMPQPATYGGGATSWLGLHAFCLRTTLNQGKIKTRYCIGSFRHQFWPHEDLIIPRQDIQIGLCLPETCDTSSFNLYKTQIEFLAKLELPDRYKESLEFNSLYCLPDERSPIRKIPTSGRIYLTILGFWALIILLASIEDQRLRLKAIRSKSREADLPKSRSLIISIVRSLSIQNSFKCLTATKIQEKSSTSFKGPEINLKYLNCMKFFMSVMIVYGHTNSVALDLAKTHEARITILLQPITRICLTFWRLIDVFFILNGLSISLIVLKYPIEQLRKPMFWIRTNAKVMFYLMPLYALTFWYSRSVAAYVNYGPFWDYGTSPSLRRFCMDEPWYRVIPYFGSSLSKSSPVCNSPSWSMIAYSRLALIGPILTYCFMRLTKTSGLLLVSLLLAVSLLNESIRMVTQNIASPQMVALYSGFLVLFVDKYESTGYQDTLTHLASFALGCYLGSVLQSYTTGSCNDWPGWFKGKLIPSLVAAYTAAVSYFTLNHNGINEEPLSLASYVILFAFIKLAWLLLVGVSILRLATVASRDIPIRFMSHPFWATLNRLKHAIYLVHLEVIIYVISLNDSSGTIHGHPLDMLRMFSFALMLSICLALIIFTIFEAPLGQLITTLLVFTAEKRGKSHFVKSS